VLTGDTVLGRGTTVVAHPDGQLGAYLDSLDRLHALAPSGRSRRSGRGTVR
jgi:glyoxylase-like metal-dependent hydrolase (beta-lactamase superfamily II)